MANKIADLLNSDKEGVEDQTTDIECISEQFMNEIYILSFLSFFLSFFLSYLFIFSSKWLWHHKPACIKYKQDVDSNDTTVIHGTVETLYNMDNMDDMDDVDVGDVGDEDGLDSLDGLDSVSDKNDPTSWLIVSSLDFNFL
jgi:hypothetical protein